MAFTIYSEYQSFVYVYNVCRNNFHGLKQNWCAERLGMPPNAPVFPLFDDRRARSVHSHTKTKTKFVRRKLNAGARALESQGRFHGRAKPSLSLRCACNQSFQLFTWKFCVYLRGGNLGTTPAGLNIQLRLIMWMYVWRKKIYGSRNYGWHLSKSSGHVRWNRVKFYWVCVCVPRGGARCRGRRVGEQLLAI